MKKTVLNKSWMFNKNGEFCGVDLGSDFCAEHEQGIDMIKAGFNIDGIIKKKITRVFGLPIRTKKTPNFGISSRTINELPSQFANGIAGNYRFIGFYDTTFSKWVDTLVKDAIRADIGNKSMFVAYWSERGFIIVSKDVDKMALLRDAFCDKNIAIFRGNTNFISNKGLVLAIASKLDDDVVNGMYSADKDTYELHAAAYKTGIQKKIDKSGLLYHAMTPRWNKNRTAVEFWLNPYDQKLHNYGWFTIAELEQWIEGTGPIIDKIKI